MKKLLLLTTLLATALAGRAQTTSVSTGWIRPALAAKPPVVRWQTPAAEQTEQKQPVLTVSVCVDSEGPLTAHDVYHNGQRISLDARGFKRTTCGQEITHDVALTVGTNAIYVVATNAAGTTMSAQRYVTYAPAPTVAAGAVQKRVALVLANASYDKHPLRNPINDGQTVKTRLEQLGFRVIHRENQSLKGVKDAINEFTNELANGSIGLFYYAGHGLMAEGDNFVQPLGADINAEADIEHECYSLRRMVARMESVNHSGANLVFWDACRNNPYRSWSRSGDNRNHTAIQPAIGTIIVYATEPGKTASDNADGANGLFTSELVKHLGEPNVDIYDLVDRIDRGLQQRGLRQPPYFEGRLQGRLMLTPAPR